MDLDLLQFLAARNVCDGKLYEPRIYAQLFDFSDAFNQNLKNPLYSDEDIFRNAEQYPVRITHVLAAIRDQGDEAVGTNDERAVQRYGLRFRMLDTFYMNDVPMPLPLFHNQVVAASDIVTRSTMSWRFAHPFYMGGRDTLSVRVALESPVSANNEISIDVWVSFHGFGALSRRPKELHGYVTFYPSSGELVIPDGFYRNDGTEPLEIHSMHATVLPPSGSAGIGTVGNIRRAKVSVRLVGNGTNQTWSTAENSSNLVALPLWGATTGRSVCHALPYAADNQRGWIREPNQGLQIEVSGPLSGADLSQLYVALLGEIIVR